MDLFVLVGVNKPGVLELVPGLNRLGRNPTNDLRVHDATVSSFHCEITVADDTVIVRDLGSTNGTFIDGRPVSEAPVRIGQSLQLGQAEYRLDRRAAQHPELARVAIPPIPAPPPLPQPVLANGAPACFKHPTLAATHKCPHCGYAFCAECVRTVGLPGSARMSFCPECDSQCQPLPTPAETVAAARTKRPSFLARLTQTIKIRLR
jgi:hypothetical protein